MTVESLTVLAPVANDEGSALSRKSGVLGQYSRMKRRLDL